MSLFSSSTTSPVAGRYLAEGLRDQGLVFLDESQHGSPHGTRDLGLVGGAQELPDKLADADLNLDVLRSRVAVGGAELDRSREPADHGDDVVDLYHAAERLFHTL